MLLKNNNNPAIDDRLFNCGNASVACQDQSSSRQGTHTHTQREPEDLLGCARHQKAAISLARGLMADITGHIHWDWNINNMAKLGTQRNGPSYVLPVWLRLRASGHVVYLLSQVKRKYMHWRTEVCLQRLFHDLSEVFQLWVEYISFIGKYFMTILYLVTFQFCVCTLYGI